MDTKHPLKASLEALLFIHGEPLSRKKISAVLGAPEKDIDEAISSMQEDLAVEGRGLSLITEGGKIQLVTKGDYAGILESFMKEELSADLSPAAVETLAIVCYFGPISKARIEYLRGVNSSFTLRNLMLRGLIEKAADPEHPASFVYSSSFDLLRHFGIARKEDLPEYEKYSETLRSLESPAPSQEEQQNAQL